MLREHIFQSLKGIHKSENQDNFLIINEDQFMVYAIFDGLGSKTNSKTATILAKSYIKKNCLTFIDESEIALNRLMLSCNEYLLARMDPELMTTYCIVYIPKDLNKSIQYSALGDTRLYTITAQFIEQLTEDDRVSVRANVLTKCLGMTGLSIHDFKQVTVEKKKGVLLLCSDGFYTFMEDNRLVFFDILNKRNLKSIKDSLYQLIHGNNADDSTYILIR